MLENSDSEQNQKWYEQTWFIAIALLICFPVGVILFMRNPRYSKMTKCGVVLIGILLALNIVFSHNKSEPQKVADKPTEIASVITKTEQPEEVLNLGMTFKEFKLSFI